MEIDPSLSIIDELVHDDIHVPEVQFGGTLYRLETDHEDFADMTQQIPADEAFHEETGLLALFESYCHERADYLDEEAKRLPDEQREATEREASLWRDEAHTWQLFNDLFYLRLRSKSDMEQDTTKQESISFKSDGYLAGKCVNEDNPLQEHMAVKEWLERTAPPFQPVEVRKYMYMYTLKQIREDKRTGNNKPKTISELDPDSILRQKKSLAPEDSTYEANLCRTLFSYIRRGRLADAADLCTACGEHWRAATLRGGINSSDKLLGNHQLFPGSMKPKVSPNLDTSTHTLDADDDSTLIPSGNRNRLIWKAVCYRLSQEVSLDLHERAVYAAMAGDVGNAEGACQSWQDHLWVRYNSLVEHHVDQRLQEQKGISPGAEVSFLSLPSGESSASSIFETLVKFDDDHIRNSANEPFHVIQTHLILNSFDTLFEGLRNSIEMSAGSFEGFPNILRFVVHLILLLRNLGVSMEMTHTNYLIQTYIDLLVAAGKGDLIPRFICWLPSDHQVELYAQFLSNLDADVDVRQAFIMAGLDNSLDMNRILKKTVEITYQRSNLKHNPANLNLFIGKDKGQLLPEDEYQIRSLEWFSFEASHVNNLIEHSNLLIRRFLLHGRVQSVAELLRRVPVTNDSIQGMSGIESVPEPLLVERVQYNLLADCLQLHQDWCTQFFSHGEEKNNETSREYLEWASKTKTQTLRAEHSFRMLIDDNLFGSLVFGNAETGARFDELTWLRTLYIPYIFMSFHQLLFETRDLIPENAEKSLQLAEIVAGTEGQEYYIDFKRANKLKEFLQLMRQSAIAILRKPADQYPWASRA